MKFFKIILSFIFFSVTAQASCLEDVSPFYEQGKDYFSRQHFLLASGSFSTFTLLSCSKEQQSHGRLRWAQSLYELGEFREGDFVLAKIPPGDKNFRRAAVIRAWYLRDTVSTLPSEDASRFQSYERELERVPDVKNPWIAGTASALLPGSRQAYNGHLQSGLYSFLLNALFAGATASFANKKMDGAAWASGVLFSVVYVGNISGAVKGSLAANQAAREAKAAELKPKAFPELEP